MPGALLREISLAFGKRNHQKRTKWAVKAKIKDLGLSVERGKQIYAFVSAMLSQKVHDEVTTSALFEEQFSIPSVQPFRVSFLAYHQEFGNAADFLDTIQPECTGENLYSPSSLDCGGTTTCRLCSNGWVC